MLRRTFDAVARISPKFRRSITRIWYEMLVVLDRDTEIRYMNYGYSGLSPAANEITLNDLEQVDRYCIRLYQHIAGAVEAH